VNTARQRLSARDYKHGGRRAGSFDLLQYRQFGVGLAVGLTVALFVWLQGQRELPVDAEVVAPVPATPEVAPAEEEIDPADQLVFYEMLPSYEVHVPDEQPSRSTDAPPIAKPGLYVIQAGSSRNRANAELERDRLGKQGIEATIQKVTIDGDEWHRVIIGPSRDLAWINSMREKLRAAKVTFRTYALGE
jgi:cell division protein FtsN